MALKFLVNFQNSVNGPNCTVPDQEKLGVDFVQQVKFPEAKEEVNTNLQDKSDFSHCEKKDH